MSPSPQSLPELLAGLATDIPVLLQKEAQLARGERSGDGGGRDHRVDPSFGCDAGAARDEKPARQRHQRGCRSGRAGDFAMSTAEADELAQEVREGRAKVEERIEEIQHG